MTAAPRQVAAFAPATVANVGSGFDVLGFAVDQPGDTVEARRRAGDGVTLLEVDRRRRPPAARCDSNTAVVAARTLLEKLGEPFGVDLVLRKGMPLASGLGSSAASAAAALARGQPAGRRPAGGGGTAAVRIGRRAAWPPATGHADNVAPALLGGFVLIRSTAPLDLVRLPVPDGLAVALLSPDVEIPTEAARRILRKRIPLADAVSQWGNLAALVASLYAGDLALMGRSLDDLIAEPVRAVLIPGFAAVKQAALHGRRHRLLHLRRRSRRYSPSPPRWRRAGRRWRKRCVTAFADAGLTAAAYVSEISRAVPAHRRPVLTGRPSGGS